MNSLPTSIQLSEAQNEWVREEAIRKGLSTPVILRHCVSLAMDMQLQEIEKKNSQVAHLKARIEGKVEHEH